MHLLFKLMKRTTNLKWEAMVRKRTMEKRGMMLTPTLKHRPWTTGNAVHHLLRLHQLTHRRQRLHLDRPRLRPQHLPLLLLLMPTHQFTGLLPAGQVW